MTNIQNLLTFIADHCALRPGYHVNRPVFIIPLPGNNALVAEYTTEDNEWYEEGEYEMLTPHGDIVTMEEAEQIVERLAGEIVNTLHENGTFPQSDGWNDHLALTHLDAIAGRIECPECHQHGTITMNCWGDLSCSCGWTNAAHPRRAYWAEAETGNGPLYLRPHGWPEERWQEWLTAEDAVAAPAEYQRH